MASKPISLRLPESLLEEIVRRVAREPGATEGDHRAAHTDVSGAARHALALYYEICRQHAPTKWLSRVELAIVCDANNGSSLLADDEHAALSITGIAHNVVDAIAIDRGALPDPATGAPQILARHCREGEPVVDGDALIARLHRASFADLVALADFVDRFWADDPQACAAVERDLSR